jgi:tellurite resistance protein
MPETVKTSRLQNLPIVFFSSVMGLGGLSLALLRFSQVAPALRGPGQVLLVLTTLWFAALTFAYLAKMARHPEAVMEEFLHPVRMNFFPAYSICLLLLAAGYGETWPGGAQTLWLFGACLHLVFMLKIVSLWFTRDFGIASFNPPWFIPVVGAILVPVAGAGFADPEVCWFFFAVGISYWVFLSAVLIYRLTFHPTLPERLLPTLFILIAPPAVGFVAYTGLAGGLDGFARVLYYFSLFTALSLLAMGERFLRIPFYLSWWAYSFPLAAITLATLRMHLLTRLPLFLWLGWFFLGLCVLVVAFVLGRTVRAVTRGEICVEEE